MKKRIILAVMVTASVLYLLSSCYRNREDLLQVPVEKVSFKKDIVPIVTSGGCGCHNLGNEPYAQFSYQGTVYYDVILARVNSFKTWVNGGSHPGLGTVDFTPIQKLIVKKWIEQGPPYDADDTGNGCTTGGETFTATILPIYNTTCKGGSCHANGTVPDLTYNVMVAKKSTLQTMMDNSGTTGHPGGVLSLTSCTVSKFKSWLSLNMPQ
jgi:hypothetical protein